MIIKVIWILTGINTLAFLIFFGMFFGTTSGRNVDGMEKGWMAVLAILGIIVILLAVLPVYFSHSSLSIFVAAFFAALPLLIALGVLISKNLPNKKQLPMAEIYYSDKEQQAIAAAIEHNDTLLLAGLIEGKNLYIQGNKVWGWAGLNYLQFAIRLRNNDGFPVDTAANNAAIKLLVEKGAATTPALAEGIKCLPGQTVALLLDNGADPNTHGYANSAPLIFDAIGRTRQQIDIAMLLVRKGADMNAKNENHLTPMMFAARNADTSSQWNSCWRFVRYLLTEAHADFTYTTPGGESLFTIIKHIEDDAHNNKIAMHSDFTAVAAWLQKNQPEIASVKINR